MFDAIAERGALPVPPRGGEETTSQDEDAPQYMSAGFRKPAEREPGCFRRAVRLPRDLAGYVSGLMTVRFAVGRDGRIGRVDVVGGAPDARVLETIVQALRSCAWVAGADARGEPTAIWVVMPLRFEMG